MKFTLNKRGRLVLACALTLGSASVAWTQLSGGPEVEWQDEVQASAAQTTETPAEDEVLPEFKMEAGRKYVPDYATLIASEDTQARHRQSQHDPLSVLTEEDQQESAIDSALSQQSSVKVSALVAGGSQFSPNAAPQYYASNGRAKLEGAGGSGGGAGGAQSQEGSKEPQKAERPTPIKDIPPQCDDKGDRKADGKPGKGCEASGGVVTPPTPGEGEKPVDPTNPVKPTDPKDPDQEDGKDKDKPKPEVSVDEPGTLALFSLGLAGLVAMSRRKKKHA